jgi:hypothetical protein
MRVLQAAFMLVVLSVQVVIVLAIGPKAEDV